MIFLLICNASYGTSTLLHVYALFSRSTYFQRELLNHFSMNNTSKKKIEYNKNFATFLSLLHHILLHNRQSFWIKWISHHVKFVLPSTTLPFNGFSSTISLTERKETNIEHTCRWIEILLPNEKKNWTCCYLLFRYEKLVFIKTVVSAAHSEGFDWREMNTNSFFLHKTEKHFSLLEPCDFISFRPIWVHIIWRFFFCLVPIYSYLVFNRFELRP